LKAKLIRRQAAEADSSAEQVQAALGVLLGYLSDHQYGSLLAQGDKGIVFSHLHVF